MATFFDKNYDINILLGTLEDNWREFVLLKEIPLIQEQFLPLICALWIQIFLVLSFLIIVFIKLYRESTKLNEDTEDGRKEEPPNNQPRNSKDILYVTGLHDAISDYYRTFHAPDPEV